LESYRGAIERCLLPSLGKTPVSDIDLPDLTDAIRGFLMVDGRPASAAYKEKVSGATKSLFRWMREQRLIASDPGSACRMS
jgi:hypothetical protein